VSAHPLFIIFGIQSGSGLIGQIYAEDFTRESKHDPYP